MTGGYGVESGRTRSRGGEHGYKCPAVGGSRAHSRAAMVRAERPQVAWDQPMQGLMGHVKVPVFYSKKLWKVTEWL